MGQRVCRYRAGLTYQHVFMKNKTDASREAVGAPVPVASP
jgi:hypothetical protein